MAFGTPSTSNTSDSPDKSIDDIAAKFGGGGGEDSVGMHAIGVHAATTSLKMSKSGEYLILRLDITDGPFAGDDVAILRKTNDACTSAKESKQARRNGIAMGTVLRALGLETTGQQLPAEGLEAACDIECFVAVTTWGDACNLQLVNGVAKSRKVGGAEVGFPDSLRNEDGKHRNYGCGVSLEAWEL